MQLREEDVAQIPSVLMPNVLGVDRDGAPENAPENAHELHDST